MTLRTSQIYWILYVYRRFKRISFGFKSYHFDSWSIWIWCFRNGPRNISLFKVKSEKYNQNLLFQDKTRFLRYFFPLKIDFSDEYYEHSYRRNGRTPEKYSFTPDDIIQLLVKNEANEMKFQMYRTKGLGQIKLFLEVRFHIYAVWQKKVFFEQNYMMNGFFLVCFSI